MGSGISTRLAPGEKRQTKSGSECGWWEEQIVIVFKNERNQILGTMSNSGGDVWVGWDYVNVSSDGKPTKIGTGAKKEITKLVERLILI